MRLNVHEVIGSIPSFLQVDTKIKIAIYAIEDELLVPCYKYYIPTGITIDCFVPLTHNIRFEGYTLPCGIECVSRFVHSLGGEEFKVQVVNYSEQDKLLREKMPLGELVISANE